MTKSNSTKGTLKRNVQIKSEPRIIKKRQARCEEQRRQHPLGKRGAAERRAQPMRGRIRKAPDRHSGGVLSWHAMPREPDQKQTRVRSSPAATAAERGATHHMVVRQALSQADTDFVLRLQRFPPEELDDDTAEFAGIGKDIWTVWPHCHQSKVPATEGARALELMKGVLAAADVCPACPFPPHEHRIYEVEMLRYTGAGSACPVHKDSGLERVTAPIARQGAVVCTLQQQCQGGILHVARRDCGRIVCREGGGPQDIARDATAVLMAAGDACVLANVDHMVTRLASGKRSVLTARIVCPESSRRAPTHRVKE